MKACFLELPLKRCIFLRGCYHGLTLNYKEKITGENQNATGLSYVLETQQQA